MAPSNFCNFFSGAASESAPAESNDGFHVPFPELTDHKPPPKKRGLLGRPHRLRGGDRSRSRGPSDPRSPARPEPRPQVRAAAPGGAPSQPLPLPKSHIRRTPSELQFEHALVQAEYSDVRMYARLVRGMTERGAGSHCRDGGGGEGHLESDSHELSRKSLMGVVECRRRVLPSRPEGTGADGDDWEVGYSYDEENRAPARGDADRASSRCAASSFPPPLGRARREVSASLPQEDEEEDDCVFSLEL